MQKNEIEECLRCIDWKREKRNKYNIYILIVVGAGLLLSYLLYPKLFYLFILLFWTTILMLFLLYYPKLKRSKKANKILRNKGTYIISVNMDGVYSNSEQKTFRFKNSYSQVIKSENVYTIKIGETFFCVPLRVLTEREKVKMYQIFNEIGIEFITVKTKKD